MNFASDNVMGASAPVMNALMRANEGAAASYGEDEITRRVSARIAALFERDAQVFLLATGTAANALALAAAVQPWGMCLCHEEAHVADDECGAPEFFTHGAKLLGLPGPGGKLTAEALAARLAAIPDAVHVMPPQAVSISQATEAGTVYRLDEIAAIAEVCRARGLKLHMDGARFANALRALDCTPAAMTAEVDILSFGATKNGCWAAEAVVVFDRKLADTLARRRKRAGHTLSKGRLIAAQLEGYLEGDHWLDNARHANAMAQRLADGLRAIPGVRIPWPVEANELFPILPARVDAAMMRAGAIYRPWSPRSLPPGERVGEGETLIRLVCSFATTERMVDELLAAARS